MKKVVILTDSCSDLGKDIREKYDIEHMPQTIRYEDKEMPASLNWDLYSAKEFYDIIRKGIRIMSTQVPVATFYEIFEKNLKEGNDIVYMGCSSALSGSVNTGKIVADELSKKYPENKIFCVDCLIAGMGQGLMTVDAAIMRNEGKSAEEIASYFEENKLKYYEVGTIDSLTCLKMAGRVKASAAFFGNLFGIKPIIVANNAGENAAIKKIKGWKKAIQECVEDVKRNIVDAEHQMIAITHADCIEDALYLKSLLEAEVKPKEIYMNFVGPCVGASTGPSTLMIFYRGNKRNIQ